MTTVPTRRSANPYATYVDLDATQQPQSMPPPPPPPSAYAPPPPPVARILPPERPGRRRIRRIGRSLTMVVSVLGVLAGSIAAKVYIDERRQVSQACGVIATIVQDMRTPNPGDGLPQGGTAATPAQWTAVLTTPLDPGLAARQEQEDEHNRRFAAQLSFHAKLRSAIVGMADDLDGLIAVRQEQGDAGERAKRSAELGDRFDGHVRAAQSACGQQVTGVLDRP